MSTRSSDERARSRAEARRRARLAARGEAPETEEEEGDDAEPAAPRPGGGGFLARLFPPAPPLPDMPDPLAGFDPSGPMHPVRVRLFLLRQNLLAWVLPGIVAFFGFYASLAYAQGALGLVGTFVMFGALIAAGWFGWQRPTLFGTTAALVSFLMTSVLILWAFTSQGAGPDSFGASEWIVTDFIIPGAYQAGLGFLGGWYGGYLRRRQTQLSGQGRRRRR